MADSVLTLLIVAATVALFIWDRLPVAVVALLVPLALWATGVLELGEATAGFGDPTILFIAALFVVSEALDATGITAWVGDLALRVGGEGRVRLTTTVMVLVALVTALITPNGSVAALTPVIVVIALRGGRSPSELLLPAAYSAHAGSLLLLIGSPVTVVIADYIAEATGEPFGLAEIGLIGLPLTLLAIGLILLLAPRLVPERTPTKHLRDLGSHGEVLAQAYDLRATGRPLLERDEGVAEYMVPPRSPYVGDRIYRGMATDSGNLVVAAMHRRGNNVVEPTTMAVGDLVLLRGPWTALQAAAADPGLIAVDDPDRVRRQAVPLGRGAYQVLVVVGAMVVLMASGIVPAAVAALLAALAIVLLGVVSVEEAYRGISWTTIILVGGMMSLSVAMVKSGAADLLAQNLLGLVGAFGPHALLAGLFVITAVLGQLISNMATALIVIPIGLAAAADMGVSPMPVLVAIAVFAAAALLTPVATPANLVVMEAAGYRFGDYWKLGLPVLVLFGIAGIVGVPLLWPF